MPQASHHHSSPKTPARVQPPSCRPHRSLQLGEFSPRRKRAVTALSCYDSSRRDLCVLWIKTLRFRSSASAFFPSPASGLVLHLPAGSPAATESRYLPTCAALGTGSRPLVLPCCSTRCALLNPKWFNQSGVCPTHPGSDTFITRCQSFLLAFWWWASRLAFGGRCKWFEKAFLW